MGVIRRIGEGVDRLQQRHRVPAFTFATWRKFSEDQAGNLAALIAYYGFFSIFPLLLVLVSVLGIVLAGHPGLQHRVLDSALVNFPVVGNDLRRNVHSLGGHTALSLALGIAIALWAGTQVVRQLENALNTVWNVPFKRRPSIMMSAARGVGMLAILGVILVVAAAVGGLGGGSGTWWWTVGGVALSLLLNVAVFLLAFRVLTVARVTWSTVLPGALVAGAAWTVLQALGGYYVGHEVRGASNTYGTFAVVIGLLGWLYVGGQVTLYAAELNVVTAERLWPRSILHRPPTAADRRALRRLAKVEERRHGQEVRTTLAEERTAGPGGEAGEAARPGQAARPGRQGHPARRPATVFALHAAERLARTESRGQGGSR